MYSLKKLNVKFRTASQDRSKKTLEDLLEAAESIADGGDPSKFDSRTLSKVSGYSLGSLVKRLGKIDNVFLYAIALGRSRHIRQIEQNLLHLDSSIGPKEFVETLVDLSFKGIKRVNPAVIRYYEKRALERTGNLGDVYSYTEEIIEPLLRVIEKNQSGKFKSLNLIEAKYICRAIFLFIERPFAEQDPIAGTEAHRQLVIENISRLISA